MFRLGVNFYYVVSHTSRFGYDFMTADLPAVSQLTSMIPSSCKTITCHVLLFDLFPLGLESFLYFNTHTKSFISTGHVLNTPRITDAPAGALVGRQYYKYAGARTSDTAF
jgi:hypothetical protein